MWKVLNDELEVEEATKRLPESVGLGAAQHFVCPALETEQQPSPDTSSMLGVQTCGSLGGVEGSLREYSWLAPMGASEAFDSAEQHEADSAPSVGLMLVPQQEEAEL